MGNKRRNRTVMGAMAFAALVWTGPTSAQGPGTAAKQVAALPAADPERLALSERVVDRIWPVGTMRRMMEASMASTVDAIKVWGADGVWDGGGSDKTTRRAQHEARTGRPLAGSSEAPAAPALFATMAPMFERMEPPLRAAIVRIYARRYDVTQLGELEAFFTTPTGAAYAADSLTLMNDPEMVAAMSEAMGEMMGAVMGAMVGEDVNLDPPAADAAADAVEVAASAAMKVE